MLDVIKVLTTKRDELLAEAEKIGKAIAALGDKSKPVRKRQRFSAAVRKKMAESARKRWAKTKKRAKADS
jgi:hypothetical protein